MAEINHALSWTPRGSNPLRVVVLASGNGTNLQAILDRFRESDRVEIAGVVSNHRMAPALDRARRDQVRVAVFPRDGYQGREARDRQMAAWIRKQNIQLVVSAGYLEILSPEFVDQFRDRIINIHPSLLPKFPGLNSIQRAHEARVWRSGVTIHFVDEGVDTGPVLKRRAVWRKPGENLSHFESRIHSKEHKLLPQVINEVALGKIKIGISQSDGLVRETRKERLARYLDQFAAMPKKIASALGPARTRNHPHSAAGAGHH